MELDELIDKISALRTQLYDLIEEKQYPFDEEVVDVSNKLDELLNKYQKILLSK